MDLHHVRPRGAINWWRRPAAARDEQLARSYHDRRRLASIIIASVNLLAIGTFVLAGGAEALYAFLQGPGLPGYWYFPAYAAILFAGHAIMNFPLELWAGYLEERQFGLAKSGIRAWSRDWLLGITQHGVMFGIGACLIGMAQILVPQLWPYALAALLIIPFLATGYLSVDLIPLGLFQIAPADESAMCRLRALARDLPPVLVFASPVQRDFAVSLIGLAGRRRLMMSQATFDRASDELLKFLVLHALAHRRSHHPLLAMAVAWIWLTVGLILGASVMPAQIFQTPPSIAWLAMTLTTWVALTQPAIEFIGRRMERIVVASYLREGGTPEEMQSALSELAWRNIQRSETLPYNTAAYLITRLSMWTPNLICRSARTLAGKPHAWFIPPG